MTDLNDLDVPEWESRVMYSTTNGASALELFRVVDAVFLADSSLVIADQGSSELLFLDRGERLRVRTGRRGEGPGEYTDIARVGVGEGGDLFVFDKRRQRLTLLDAGRNVAGIHQVDLQGRFLPFVPMTRLASGAFMAVLETRPLVPPGLHRQPLHLVVVDSGGQLTDTLGVWPGKEFHAIEGGDRWMPVGFARTALYAGRGAYTVVGTTDSLDLTLYSGAKPVMRLQGAHAPVLVSDDEKEGWTELYLATKSEQVRPRWRGWIEQSTIRQSYPAFGALAVDAAGRIWVGEYAGLGQQRRRWTVFGPDGRPVGRLGLPVYRPESLEVYNSIPGYVTHELLDVMSDRVAILRKDEFDVQYVEVLQIVEPR